MTTKQKQRYFLLAKNAATLSDFSRCHHGTVVVYKGKVIGAGYNCHKSHPLQRAYNIERFLDDDKPHSLHSEIHALYPLVGANIEWNKVCVFNYRQKRTGEIGMSRPCASCMRLLKDLGVHHIYYTTDDGYAEESI